MGKKIDQFILSAAAAAAFYLFYQKAFVSRPLSIFLAFLSFIVLRKTLAIFSGVLSRFPWSERRKLRKQAGSALMKLAMLPEEEAQKKLSRLIMHCYSEDIAPVVIQNHPSQPLSQQQIFEAWKAHRGKDKLLICTTGIADPSCKNMAAGLRQPRCALVDAALLSALIAEHPEGFTFEKGSPGKLRLCFSRIPAFLLNRKNAPRCLLLALSMAALYLMSGRLLYLICGLSLLFAALASLRQAVRPAKLF